MAKPYIGIRSDHPVLIRGVPRVSWFHPRLGANFKIRIMLNEEVIVVEEIWISDLLLDTGNLRSPRKRKQVNRLTSLGGAVSKASCFILHSNLILCKSIAVERC